VSSTPRPGQVGHRRRPVAHFTSRRGWINDPYGVHWDGTRYHLYYQALPARRVWSAECAWGHAVSDDLTHWDERDAVLSPQAFELGCWSGTVVADPRLAFYTRVSADDQEAGAIATAAFVDGTDRLVSRHDDIVIPGPPADLPVAAFRDPYVVRVPAGWAMVVGGSLADGTGAVFHYESDDLRHWTFTGLLSHGRVDKSRADVSEVWECPQLIRVGDSWSLIVSLLRDHRADHVAAAIGCYDGHAFVHSGWQPLTFGTSPYATSAFIDRDGLSCMISWLREDAGYDPERTAWAGAHSVVCRLDLDADRLVVVPHPNLERDTRFEHIAPAGGTERTQVDLPRVSAEGRPTAEWLTIAPGEHRGLDVLSDGAPQLSLTMHGRNVTVELRGRGGMVEEIPRGASHGGLDLLLDSDIVEIFNGGAYGAWRLPR
jgi:beta-fructofuranosidase